MHYLPSERVPLQRCFTRMLPSSYYDRIVDVAEELVRFTVLTRGHADQLVDRYSERKDRNEPVITPAEMAGLPGT